MAETPNALPGGYKLHEYRIESVLGVGGFGLGGRRRAIVCASSIAMARLPVRPSR